MIDPLMLLPGGHLMAGLTLIARPGVSGRLSRGGHSIVAGVAAPRRSSEAPVRMAGRAFNMRMPALEREAGLEVVEASRLSIRRP